MKSLWLLLALPLQVLSQSTFLKVYPDGLSSDLFKDMIYVSANEYAFITRSIFYRVDNQGNILVKKDLKEGIYTSLESLTMDNAGNFYIAGQVSTSIYDTKMVLHKLNSSGQVLFSKTIVNSAPHRLRISNTVNNGIFFTYTIAAGADYQLIITRLDDQGRELWKKVALDKSGNLFAAHAGTNGSQDIVIITPGNNKTWLLQADAAGNISLKEVLLPQQAGLLRATRDFCRTPDGGYVFAGDASPNNKPGNGLLYKTDKDGQLQWQREINIHRGDRFMSLVAAADGYVLLGTTGLEGNWGSAVAGDLLLIKTDGLGNIRWKRALGTANADQALQVLIPDANSILVSAQIYYPGYSAPIPLLCKTDNQGNLPATLPFQPAPPNTFKKIAVNEEAPVQRLTAAIPAANNTLIAGGNFLDKTDDQQYPFLFKADHTGQALWHKRITATPGLVRAVANTLDAHYIGLIEQNGFIGKLYTLVKFTANGDTLWTTQIGATILRDIIATSDGGYLLSGSEDLTLSNLDALLIKTDGNGKEVWRKKTGISTHWETARSIKETPEHDFIIAGNSQLAFGGPSNAWACKMSKEGNVLWSTIFDAGIALNYLSDVAITPDNNYIMTGAASPGFADKKDVLVICLNRQGHKLWEKTYDLHLLDEGLSVHYTSGDTILVAGSTGEPAAGRLEQYGYLMKLNKEGNKQSVQYFGAAGVQTSVEKILMQGDQVVLAGNTQDEYGEGHMYLTKAGTAPSAEQPGAEALTLYPNPAWSKTFISMKNNYNGPVNIVLYNTTGQQVMVLQRTKTSFELKEEVSLTSLSSGMYYFFIQQGNDKSVKRLEIVNR